MPRDDEQRAIDDLLAHLADCGNELEYWPAEDPPDFWLQMNGRRLAIEVTTITAQYERDGKSAISDIGFDRMVSRLADEVESLADEIEPLDAWYGFHLEGSYGNFEAVHADIREKILEFIARNRNIKEVLPSPVRLRGYELWLFKHASTSPGVNYAYGTSHAVEESIAEFNGLLDYAVREKQRKLSNIYEPKILVLINRYWGHIRNYLHECHAKYSPTFEAVYIVEQGADVHPLKHT